MLLSARTSTTRGDKNISIDFPSICSPLPSAIESHLQDLPLADECDEPRKEVDMLIGSNFYWSFVTGDVVKSSERPVAVGSKLGWLLSGPIDSHKTDDV